MATFGNFENFRLYLDPITRVTDVIPVDNLTARECNPIVSIRMQEMSQIVGADLEVLRTNLAAAALCTGRSKKPRRTGWPNRCIGVQPEIY